MTLLPVSLFCSLLLSGAVQALELDSLEIKMINIMDRMTKMEVDMEYKDQRIVALENSRQEMMSAMNSKDFTISALTDALEERDVAMSQLEKKVKGLTSESSYFYECGWREEWSLDNENVTYEKLLYSSNSGVDGGLNITTGVFTAGTSGTWTISYSATSVQYSGDIIQAFLYLNGQQVVESQGRFRKNSSIWGI